MARIVVNAEQLRAEADRLRTTADRLQHELDALRIRVAPLATEWSGGASAAFQARWDQWHTSQTTLIDALHGMSNTLEQAANAYQEAESSIAQQLRG